MKKRMIGGLFFSLMIFGILFSFELSNGFCLGDYLLNKLGLKAWSNDEERWGLRYTFFYGLAFVIIGWRGAEKYLRDSRLIEFIKKRPFIFFLALILFVVPAVLEVSKDTYYWFQDDLKAIEYHSKESICHIDTEGERKKISGTISLTNHSKEVQEVALKLVDKEYFPEDIILKDNQGQSTYRLLPGQKDNLSFNFYIDKGKTAFDGASITGPEIRFIKKS